MKIATFYAFLMVFGENFYKYYTHFGMVVHLTNQWWHVKTKSSCRGIFGSESREHYASGGEGVQEKRPLSGPPHTHSKHNKPTAKAQSRSSASPPSVLSLSQSCQNPTREPNPEKRRLTLAGELSGKFLYRRAERGSKFSLITCIKALIPFIRSLLSQSHVIPISVKDFTSE